MPPAKQSYPHLVWAAGHALVILGTLYTLLHLFSGSSLKSKSYYIAYGGAIVSWGIVVVSASMTSLPNEVIQADAFLPSLSCVSSAYTLLLCCSTTMPYCS